MLILAAAGEPAAADGRPRSEPIQTRQTFFAIPFRIERTDQAATEPAAVQLQVSVDQGKTWKVYSKVQPNLDRFHFRADGDGEYWFAVQTVDQQGGLRPPQLTVPGLRVIVDTTTPRIDLDARRGPNGEITLRWRIAEPNLDPESMRVFYRTDTAPNLQSVAIDRKQLAAAGPIRFGDVSWWLQQGGTRAEIRVEVRDRAGNAAISHAQVNLQATTSQQPQPNPATPSPQTAGTPAQSWRGGGQSPSSPRWQPQRTAVTTVGNAGGGPRLTGPPSAGAAPTASWPSPEGSVAIQINPALGNQYSPPSAAGTSNEAHDPSRRPRMVNSQVFELEYAVDAVGPSGIARVELWGTRDNGQTWTSFGVDEDKQSPLVITVKEEGIYGFRIAVESGMGLGGEPPASGTAPDVWIGVDLTKPDVRVISAEQLTGQHSGEIVIGWEAHDPILAHRPVSLLYSGSPGGPWLPVAENQEASGRYTWLAGKDVPDQVYLRIEARDDAGNIGIFESPQAITLDRLPPTGRIRDIRPVNPSDRGPQA
jgi:hypothetical protein